MGTVTKALDLLDLFSADRPCIGLSDCARAAGLNKATCLRLLRALEARGFVEQAGSSWRIGPAPLRLAALREATVPQRSAAMPVLQALAANTGETAHLSQLSGGRLCTLAHAYPPGQALRVSMEDAAVLPFHATASGIVMLAFGPAGLRDAVLCGPLPSLTADTPTDPATLSARIEAARRDGLAEAPGTFEAGVHGIAVPVFDTAGICRATLALAAPASRAAPDLPRLRAALRDAAGRLHPLWGGPPAAAA
ncbi:MAG: IclR family transcriptional regulator [Gemmobacter sp.]